MSRRRSGGSGRIESSARRQRVRMGSGTGSRFGLRLTGGRAQGMIRRSPVVASIGRARLAPLTPRAQESIPLRLPTPSRPRADRQGRSAATSADGTECRRPETREPERNNERTHDVSNHHRIGGRSIRGDAPNAPPLLRRRSPLLQHQWLHLLPRGRSGHEDRDLPDLRLHPPDPLSGSSADCGRSPRVASHGSVRLPLRG